MIHYAHLAMSLECKGSLIWILSQRPSPPSLRLDAYGILRQISRLDHPSSIFAKLSGGQDAGANYAQDCHGAHLEDRGSFVEGQFSALTLPDRPGRPCDCASCRPWRDSHPLEWQLASLDDRRKTMDVIARDMII
jgi:hypothetical protein